jgi:lipopolysaccharide export system protein LptA
VLILIKYKKILFLIILSVIVGLMSGTFAHAKGEKKKIEEKKTELKASTSNIVNMDSDFVEYFEEKEVLVATGHVIIVPEGQDSVIEADKVTYERLTDILIAEKNVKITQNNQVIYGDFARIDLKKDTALINQVNTEIDQIKINAKTANIYPKKKDPSKKDVEAFDGKATMNDKNTVYMLSRSGSKFINPRNTNVYNNNMAHDVNNEIKIETNFKPSYHIHSKSIVVKRGKNTDIVTLKSAVISVNRHKIFKYPSLVLTSNKENKQVETNLPEIGSMNQLGTYFGAGPVFCMPNGATLKVAPLLTIRNKGGVGALTRFTSNTNKTELAYGTSMKKVVLNGEQQLPFISDRTKLQYGSNDYVDNGFFGRQLQKNLVELVDERNLASAYNFNFDLRSSAGYLEQNAHWGTGKFQLQSNIYNLNPLYKIGKHIDIGANAQTSMAVYGSGDSYGVLRIGPTMAIAAGPVYSWLAYYQGGIYGETPIDADRFYYGKSNLSWNSSYRVNRVLTVGYNTSLNLSKDNYDQKLLAENQFYMWVGPPDLKFQVAFDTKRKTLQYNFIMLLGADRTELEFDKLRVTEK